jgi:NarL family two-component system response regulator LiaR
LGGDLDRIRVLIADDHTLVRDGTRRILESEKDLEVVAEASNGEEAVALTSSLRPDIAIIDIAMPVLDGIEVTRQIKALYPETAILILTAHDNDQFIYNLLEAGAAGYLLKSVRSQELVDAVRALHAGESVLHPAIARKVLNYFASPSGRDKKQGRSESLTQREQDILKLVTKGFTNKEIADELSLSARTVQRHLESIFNKLQVGSRTEAVVRALKEGWVTLNDVP